MPYETELELHRIHPNPRNKNVHTEESVDQLAANIKAYVLINPIAVAVISRDQYEIIAGERRWKAYQKLGRKKIPARVYEAGMDDLTIDGMRLSENRIRTFELIAECQEFANLHRQGKSGAVLAREFGELERTLLRKVAFGYFPEAIMSKVRAGKIHTIGRMGKTIEWSYTSLAELLPLRISRVGNVTRLNAVAAAHREASLPHDEIYDFTEVEQAVDRVNSGEIVSLEELRAYVSERQLDLLEANFEAEMKGDLEDRLEEAKSGFAEQLAAEADTLKQQIGAEYQERFAETQLQLQQAIREAQTTRDQRIRAEANQMDEVRRLRESMTEAHRKEMEQKEKAFSGQLAQLQKDLATARQDREKSLRDAEARLKREYDRKVAALESSAGKTQEEIAATKEVVAGLQQTFDARLQEKEQEINRRYEEQSQALRGHVETVTAERERWKSEVVSRDDQLRQQAGRVAELQRDHERQLEERQRDIAAKDRRIAELARQMAGVEAVALQKSQAAAEKEAQAKGAEYRAQLDAEYDRKRHALEQSFAQRQKALEIKVKKTGDDAINHLMDTVNKLDASVRLVVYDLSEHLDRHQRADVLLGLRRIEQKVADALQYMEGLETQVIDVEMSHG